MNTTKRILITLTVILACFRGFAQTDAPPSSIGSPILELLTHTNLVAATYAMADTTDGTFGGGVALGYRLSDFAVPFLRMDYTHGHIWTVSGSLQLQVPIYFGRTAEKPQGSWTITPFGVGGIATSFNSGDAGNLVTIAGLGVAARPSSANWGFLADCEWWNGGPFKNNMELRFGPYIRF